MPSGQPRSPLRATAALFDLDGTLVHTAPDLAEAVRRALRDVGRPPASEDAVQTWIGDGVSRLVKRALTGEREAEPDPDLFERAFDRFLAHYQAGVSRESRPYPGVREGLDALRVAGVPCACVTSKLARFTEPLLRDVGLAGAFSVVVSGDTLPERKPDPRPLLYACRQLQVPPRSTVFVGDSEVDALAARAAGIPFVAVPYGYNAGRDPRSLGADVLIESLAALPAVVAFERRSHSEADA